MTEVWVWICANPLIVFGVAGWVVIGVTAPVLMTLSDDRKRRITALLRDAIRLANQTMGQAAQEADINQAQFQRQIEMAEGSLKRLAMQPDAFWQWLGVAISSEFGLPVEAQRAARLAFATRGLKRQARARLAAERGEGVA